MMALTQKQKLLLSEASSASRRNFLFSILTLETFLQVIALLGFSSPWGGSGFLCSSAQTDVRARLGVS